MSLTTRRQFVRSTIGAGLALGAMPLRLLAVEPEKTVEADVGATEDLMREHGALNRILLIYEESMKQLEGRGGFDPDALIRAGSIVRRFVEEYHEKLEEEHVFPALEKAGRLAKLTAILRKQHEAGRKVTADIIRLASERPRPNDGRIVLRATIEKFVRMYRPHEAREDTVLFPALHQALSEEELQRLGERFEGRERELFGASGFEGIVDEIADIEKSLGIYDLAKFTP